MVIAKRPPGREIPNNGSAPHSAKEAPSVAAATARDLVEIDPSKITDCGLVDRHVADTEIETLAESIRANGQQVPILVHGTGEQTFGLIAGRRRRLACLLLGQSVLSRVVPISGPSELHALQIIENKDRLDVSFSEYVLTFARVPAETREEIWERAGFDKQWKSHVRKILASVPEELLTWIGADQKLGRQRLRVLADKLADAPEAALSRINDLMTEGPKPPNPAQRLRLALAAIQPPEKNLQKDSFLVSRTDSTAILSNGVTLKRDNCRVVITGPQGGPIDETEFDAILRALAKRRS